MWRPWGTVLEVDTNTKQTGHSISIKAWELNLKDMNLTEVVFFSNKEENYVCSNNIDKVFTQPS